MKKRTGFLERPLDWVFSTPSSVAVLRALRDSREGMSGRAVARASGFNHQTCALTLNRLEGLRLVKRQGSGKTQLLSLNFNHFLIREVLLPLFRKERELKAHIRTDIVKIMGGRILSAAIFGSAVCGKSKPDSDIDLIVIVPANVKASAKNKTENLAYEFIQRYGIRLSAIVMTVREAKNRISKSDPLMENILMEGIDLLPEKIKEVLK